MNVLLWLTHHIMLFLLGLQSSMTMSSCSQSCVWQYFYQKRWPAENDKGTDVVAKMRSAGFHDASTAVCGWGSSSLQQGWGKVNEREIIEGRVWRGQLSSGGWIGHSEKGDKSLSLLNDVCEDVSPFYRLHISLLPLYLHSLFLALSVVSVALRCWWNEN